MLNMENLNSVRTVAEAAEREEHKRESQVELKKSKKYNWIMLCQQSCRNANCVQTT